MPVAYGYCRVSTEAQAESGLGLAAQKDAVKKYYDYKFANSDVTWGDFFVDPAVSGSKPFRNRDAGGQLHVRLEAGDHIIMTRLDRGFRRFRDSLEVLDVWKERGVTLHLLDCNVDTSTPIGELFLRILGCFADYERRLAAERTRDALKQRKAQGKPVNQYVGYGFRMVGRAGRRQREADPEERAVMRQIVAWRMQGHSFESIASHLFLSGIRTRKGTEWSRSRCQRAFNAEILLQVQENGILPK